MNTKLYIIIALLGLMSGCDFLDPREADPNPDLTQDAIIGTGSATGPWIVGLERQLALVTQNFVVESEIASDNYINTSTFFNTNFDDLFIQYGDPDIDNLLFAVSDLRESTKVGLEIIVPSDESTNNNDLAEIYYFRGIAFLIQAEFFVACPVEGGGAPQPASVNLDSAVVNFNKSISLTTDAEKEASYHLLLARTYYDMGDQANATAQANALLALSTDYLRVVQYDNTNGPTSTIQDAIYDRSNFDLQPLPRLDFLDPKFGITGANEADFPFAKAEEAYLILAEAAIANQDVATAKQNFSSLLSLVATRPTRTIPEVDQRRERGGTGAKRPNGSDIVVRASPQDPFMPNLILARADSIVSGSAEAVDVTVPTISGTSVTLAEVNAITTPDEALEMCYLLRQEIFMAEGRRMQDLGIKWPLSQDEALQNENINDGDAVLEPEIPSFLPTDAEMDQFTWNRATGEVTITYNMNKVIVANKTSEFIVPFE